MVYYKEKASPSKSRYKAVILLGHKSRGMRLALIQSYNSTTVLVYVYVCTEIELLVMDLFHGSTEGEGVVLVGQLRLYAGHLHSLWGITNNHKIIE